MHKTYSNTQRQLFSLCPRKYSYRYKEGLADPVGLPAIFSKTAVHPVFQAAWGEDTKNTLEAYWQKYIEEAGQQAIFQAPACSRAVLEKLVEASLRFRAAARADGWACLGIERTFGSPTVQTEESQYRTRVDVVEARGSEVRVLEVKFTTRQREKPWGIDNQLVGHAACAGATEVVVVEVISEPPTTRKKGRIDVTWNPLRISEDLKAEWMVEASFEMAALGMAWDTDIWPKNTQSCQSFGQPCNFLDLCKTGALRESLYKNYEKAVYDGPPREESEE